MEELLEKLIDNNRYQRQNLNHQITTATKLGYQLEVHHLRDLRESVENWGYDLKAISEQYEKEKTNPNRP